MTWYHLLYKQLLGWRILNNIKSKNIRFYRGKFAVVKKCRHKENGMDFAAKFQRKRRKGKDCRHELIQEVRMLEHDHPNLVQLVEVFETSHEIIIVTE